MNKDQGICAGCGAKYPSEVSDLYTKPGTTEEYCQECAGPLMLEAYLATVKQALETCPYCKNGHGMMGKNAEGEPVFCPWCEEGRELAKRKNPVRCRYCMDTEKIKARDGETDCIMCKRRGVVKLFTTKEGMGAVRD